MVGRLLKNATLWVLVAGFLGFASARLLGSPSWPTLPEPPVLYEMVLFVKETFLALLRMLIAPIVFFSLLGGLLNIGDLARLRTMGAVAIAYYIGTTAVAIILGLTVVFFIHPWQSIGGETLALLQAKAHSPDQIIDPNAGSLFIVFKEISKRAFVNPFEAFAEANIIGLVTCAMLAGMAMLFCLRRDSVLKVAVEDINRIIYRVLSWVIWLTPLGVFAIIFDFSLTMGSGVLAHLASFAGVVFGATAVHGLVVLPLFAYLFAGKSPRQLFPKLARPMLVAFSTSSSSATLPVSMQVAESELGVSRGVSGFVFPLGATMNMDGTALFEGVAAVFLAYLFGVELSPVAMFSVFLMAMVSSIGAPGMPSGSMAGMQMVLLAAGIPLEAIGILMVIERPLDTFRTAVNVEGDIIGALVVQRYMNSLPAAAPLGDRAGSSVSVSSSGA